MSPPAPSPPLGTPAPPVPNISKTAHSFVLLLQQMAGLRLNVGKSVRLGGERPVPGQPSVKDFVEELESFLTEMIIVIADPVFNSSSH